MLQTLFTESSHPFACELQSYLQLRLAYTVNSHPSAVFTSESSPGLYLMCSSLKLYLVCHGRNNPLALVSLQ
ncbi:hypothetical protein D5086_013411 [Populus alba]|uniref:Uncharacterized protein n=1 Tax=Populus alba TaxID=43335 RepID=A0ACC4C7N7_POPAL